jgi:hypothetical protein
MKAKDSRITAAEIIHENSEIGTHFDGLEIKRRHIKRTQN